MPCATKEAQAASARRHYEKNKELIKARAAENRRKMRLRIRQYVREVKESSPCTDCGVSYPYYVMQFDHTGTNKIFNVGTISNRTLSAIQMEIAKCELVCANCHAIRTHNR